MDGDEIRQVDAAVAAAIAQFHPGLKVLFMSGYPRDREKELSVADEHVMVLGKPFSSRVDFNLPQTPSCRTLPILPGQSGELLPSDLMVTLPSAGSASTMA